jgi:8-oxo-dGTP diphosphatase
MDGMWVAGVAGHIEFGETAVSAVAREAGDELGIQLDPGSLQPATIMQRTDGTANPNEQRASWFFTATVWSGVPAVMEAHKCARIAWFFLANLPEPIPDYERLVLDGFASGNLVAFTSFGF